MVADPSILHRPRTVPAEKKERAAPPVLEFDKNGKFHQAWGGPSDRWEWPDTEHGIYVDGEVRTALDWRFTSSAEPQTRLFWD